jgi:hypothetical protein
MLMSTLNTSTAVPLALSLAAGLAFGVIVSGPQQAVAHSWYPAKCCSGQDCQKVDSIEKLDDGDLRFRAGSISVVVPAEFMRLPSPDNDTHVCVYRVGSGEYRPRCVFVPGLI